KPLAPARGQAAAAPQLRALLRRARDLGAHLHIDMESLDSRETVLGLVFELLSEPEFRDGPSAGVVAQAYLRDAVPTVERILDWARAAERTTPLTVRLVKGAYWDQELISACQHGWAVPVWESQADTDACFRTCSELLLDAFPLVRTAVGSHNVDSIAHAVAYARTAGLAPGDVEYQVLRGLGDGLARALAREGLRCRVYSPVGDMVAGMAYLVRRLLENSANVGFATNFGS
ncbi:MAG: proline dehydrogenase family protein, partial [Solirubrobacterales bacterium]|nr:proline dehydrogenase family protein [Solirubrobacterales bacterium]